MSDKKGINWAKAPETLGKFLGFRDSVAGKGSPLRGAIQSAALGTIGGYGLGAGFNLLSGEKKKEDADRRKLLWSLTGTAALGIPAAYVAYQANKANTKQAFVVADDNFYYSNHILDPGAFVPDVINLKSYRKGWAEAQEFTPDKNKEFHNYLKGLDNAISKAGGRLLIYLKDRKDRKGVGVDKKVSELKNEDYDMIHGAVIETDTEYDDTNYPYNIEVDAVTNIESFIRKHFLNENITPQELIEKYGLTSTDEEAEPVYFDDSPAREPIIFEDNDLWNDDHAISGQEITNFMADVLTELNKQLKNTAAAPMFIIDDIPARLEDVLLPDSPEWFDGYDRAYLEINDGSRKGMSKKEWSKIYDIAHKVYNEKLNQHQIGKNRLRTGKMASWSLFPKDIQTAQAIGHIAADNSMTPWAKAVSTDILMRAANGRPGARIGYDDVLKGAIGAGVGLFGAAQIAKGMKAMFGIPRESKLLQMIGVPTGAGVATGLIGPTY